jgi:hypothetical protein
VRAEEAFPIRYLFGGQDHGFSAAERQSGQRVLVCHPARQAERVRQCLLVATVTPEPGAAERRAERRVVYGDDSPVVCHGVMPEEDLLMPFDVLLKNLHLDDSGLG